MSTVRELLSKLQTCSHCGSGRLSGTPTGRIVCVECESLYDYDDAKGTFSIESPAKKVVECDVCHEVIPNVDFSYRLVTQIFTPGVYGSRGDSAAVACMKCRDEFDELTGRFFDHGALYVHTSMEKR